jgi:hypothetical protein
MSIGAVVAGVEKAHFERQAPREDWARVRVVPVGTAASSIIDHLSCHDSPGVLQNCGPVLSAQRSALIARSRNDRITSQTLYSDKAYYTSGRRASS